MIGQGLMVDAADDYEDALALAADEGFDFVELNAENGFHRRRTDPERLGALAADRGVDLVVHLPYRLDPGSPHEHVREGACRELEAALDAAAAMDAEKAVFHAVSHAHADRWLVDEIRSRLYDSIRRVDAHAADVGVEACVENLKSPFFDAGDFPDLFERTDATGCLDTGHAAVTGQEGDAQADLIRERGDRVGHVHLNDTRSREDDEHLPVGMGDVEFGSITNAIVETDWSGTCTHELWPYRPDYALASKRRFDRLLADVAAGS